MAEFECLKCELFQGGEKELRPVIEKLRSISATPIEREFKEPWAKELKKRIIAGYAIPFQWVISKLPSGGRSMDLRINGQHSSWALDELLKAGLLPDNLAIFLTTYSTPTQESAVRLFRQFDSMKSSRSADDISGAYQCWQEDLRECSRSVLRRAVEGIHWYRRVAEGLPVQPGVDMYELFNEKRLHPFFLMMHAIVGKGKANEMKRMAVMAAAFGSWQEDARQAHDFWLRVSQGSNRSEEDAATDLDNELLRLKDDRPKPSPPEIFAKCFKAWDAFGKHSRVNHFKVNIKKGLPRFSGDDADAA